MASATFNRIGSTTTRSGSRAISSTRTATTAATGAMFAFVASSTGAAAFTLSVTRAFVASAVSFAVAMRSFTLSVAFTVFRSIRPGFTAAGVVRGFRCRLGFWFGLGFRLWTWFGFRFRLRFRFGFRFWLRLWLRLWFFNRLVLLFRLLNIGIRFFCYYRLELWFGLFDRFGFRLRLGLLRFGRFFRSGRRTFAFGGAVSTSVATTQIRQIDKLNICHFRYKRFICFPQKRNQTRVKQ